MNKFHYEVRFEVRTYNGIDSSRSSRYIRRDTLNNAAELCLAIAKNPENYIGSDEDFIGFLGVHQISDKKVL